MSNQTKPTLIYRMVHHTNLDGLLTHGLHCANSNIQIPNYINIGNTSLITNRNSINIGVQPFGTLKDYVPFYFCPRSPMLYCIHNQVNTSFYGPQSDIIYLVSSIEEVEKAGLNYVFTDGHAYLKFSNFYNKKSDLINLDWSVIQSTNWSSTNLDPDRKRRKQAEFLVYNTLPIDCLVGLGVHNIQMENYVKKVLTKHGKNIYTKVMKDWYY